MLFRCLLTAFLFASALLGPVVRAGAENDVAGSISVETRLEQRLKQVLTEVTGSDRILVIVKAEVERTKAYRPSSDSVVLPGVPIRKAFGDAPQSGPEPDIPQGIVVKKLSVNVMLDESIPESMVGTVKEIASSVIGLNASRGDHLEVKRTKLKSSGFKWGSLFYPPQIFWLILAVLGSFFLLSAAIFLINPFKKLGSVLTNVNLSVSKGAGAPVRELGNGEYMVEQPGGPKLVDGDNGSEPMLIGHAIVEEQEVSRDTGLPFGFVKERHLQDLAFILKDEPPQDAAIVISYVAPEFATRLMDFFTEEQQVEIAVCLSDMDEISPKKVHMLEETIKSRLDYVVRGEDKAASILGMTSDEVRNRVLDLLAKRDAGAASRLRQKAKGLEEIILDLPPQALQAVYRQVEPAVFAQILKSTDEDVQRKVLSSLSEGAAERLSQEMELSRPLPPERLRREKMNLVAVIRRLGVIEEGAI